LTSSQLSEGYSSTDSAAMVIQEEKKKRSHTKTCYHPIQEVYTQQIKKPLNTGNTFEIYTTTMKDLTKTVLVDTLGEVESMCPCPKCGMAFGIDTDSKQTRKADEGQTVFFKCPKCNHGWKKS